MRTITIGDLHGSDVWNVINPDLYDKIIFVGDYVDSFDYGDSDIINNLLNIIQFKRSYMDKVVLLLGNHDIMYMFLHPRFKCSGFRESYAIILNKIFNANYELFQFSFQQNNYLWTHAGVHKGWFKERLALAITDVIVNNKESLLDEKGAYVLQNISEELNYLFSKQHDVLFDICKLRGGHYNVGGPLWADKRHTYRKPLLGLRQIVGHSKVDDITTIDINKKTSITFVDCLDKKINFYKLTI